MFRSHGDFKFAEFTDFFISFAMYIDSEPSVLPILRVFAKVNNLILSVK